MTDFQIFLNLIMQDTSVTSQPWVFYI